MLSQNPQKSKPRTARVEPPPHDAEAEAGALACVLDGGNESATRLEQLQDSDFYDVRHVTVFRALLAMAEDRELLDSVALALRLKAAGTMQDAGGQDYVYRLPDAAPSSANWPAYLRTVKDRAARREMLATAEQQRRAALDLSLPVAVATSDTLRAKLTARLFCQSNALVEPVSVFSLAGTEICTPGNLTSVSAQVKAGKTAVVGAMMAAALAETPRDCLGFRSSNPQRRALVHLDTEQAPFDHAEVIRCSLARAGVALGPEWLRSYCVTGFSVSEIRKAIRFALAEAHQRFGGIHSVIVDGVADCVADVNDPAESNAFVAELHALAIQYSCPIVAVIHLNPSSDNKTRGHLGSQLERKAETNLRLKKDESGVVTVFSDKNRRAPIPEPTAPRFAWSAEHHMHMSVPSAGNAKRDARRVELIELRDEAFRLSGKSALHWTELVEQVRRLPGNKAERTAQRTVGELKQFGLLQKDLTKRYEPSN